MDKSYYVYGIYEKKSPLDNCFYIGKGTGNRMYRHFEKSHTNKNLHKYNKINKIRREDGDFYVSKIKDNLSEELAFELERFLIKEIGIENLTNLTYGGEGESPSKSTRQKMSEAHKGKERSESLKQKISEVHSNKVLSKDVKDKISKSNSKENNPRSKLSKTQAQEIKWLSLKSNLTQSSISSMYPVGETQISQIKTGDRWKNIKPRKPNDYGE